MMHVSASHKECCASLTNSSLLSPLQPRVYETTTPAVMNGSSLRQRLFPSPGTQYHQERSPVLEGHRNHSELAEAGQRLLQSPVFPDSRQPQRDGSDDIQATLSTPSDYEALDVLKRARQADSQRSRLILGSRYLSPKVDDGTDDAHSCLRPVSAMSMITGVPHALTSPHGVSNNYSSHAESSPRTTPNVSRPHPFSSKRPTKSLRQRLDTGTLDTRI